MVTLGVIIFAGASALCGLTPKGSLAEAWIVTFRVVQGAGGAIMFPAALAIVVQTFPLRERGKALALFFGIAGGLTAIGPILGGYLTQWTWRAIFWVNIPVALIALVLIAISKPVTDYRPARMDYRGLALIAAGVALSVFGFQQSSIWGWHNPAIWLCIVGGLALLVVFYRVERRTESPLIKVDIFRIRPFLVENLVLGISMLVFIPVFFFASEYAQISLGKTASNAGLFLLYFFIGFVIAAQIGGRMLDRAGPSGRWRWAACWPRSASTCGRARSPTLSFGNQQWYIILAGAGMGFMLGPASTDAVNRASAAVLRRGHRHHPDRPQLRREPGPGDPGHDPGHRHADPAHRLAGGPGPAEGPGAGAGGPAVPVAEQQRQRQRVGHVGDPALLPAGLRLRDPDRAVRDGRDHGRRGDRGHPRAAAWRPGRPGGR